MFKFFKTQHYPVLGVDISSTAVRLLELSPEGQGHAVTAYAIAQLPTQTIDGHTIQDIGVVASTIKNLLTTASFSTSQAAFAIPDALAISKIIQINPGLCHQEIEALVMVEAEHSIPYPLRDIYLDFNVLGPSSQNKSMQEVLMVATRSLHVQHRMNAITLAGLKTVLVDVESYAIERAVSRMVSDLPCDIDKKNIVVLEVESESTHVFLLQSSGFITSREFAFDEEQTTAPFHESILLNLRCALQFFSVTSLLTVDYIILAGFHARHLGLLQNLQMHLNIPIVIANPLAHMNHSNQVNSHRIEEDAPVLIKALGLALRLKEDRYESY